MRSENKIPAFAKWLLSKTLPMSESDFLLGDFEFCFNRIVEDKGHFSAVLWYWLQLFKTAPEFIKTSKRRGALMFKNYIKMAFRNMIRYKGYTFLNVTGLALGLACCMLIMFWVLDETSYNAFHENADNLFLVEQDQSYSGQKFHVNVTSYIMGPFLTDEIPEVKYSTRYAGTGTLLMRHEEILNYERRVRAVDPEFLDMFTFPLLDGDKNTCLDDPYSIVIDEATAEKYFGDTNPIGKVFTVNNQYSLTVTGVLKDLPTNSTIRFRMLVSIEFTKTLGRFGDNWGNNIFTYVQTIPGSIKADVNKKMTDLVFRKMRDRYSDQPELLSRIGDEPSTMFMLDPVKRIRLYQTFGFSNAPGRVQFVYIFSIIAIFILLIACINFMNLSTARAANRSKEIGMRKVTGALKRNLITQFYVEAITLSLLAMVLSIGLIIIFLPFFNDISGKTFTLAVLQNRNTLLGMFIITLTAGILAGSYPALYMSRFNPIKSLKGSASKGSKSSNYFRKGLVVFQFSLSIILIIGTMVVFKQLDYMLNKYLGYDKDAIVFIPLRGNSVDSYPELKSELLQNPLVRNVSGLWQNISGIGANGGGAEWEGKDPEIDPLIGFNFVDYSITETLGIEIVNGRSFSVEHATDAEEAFLVNEEVVKIMGVDSPVDMHFEFWGRSGKIVGVMKNFHYQRLNNNIQPLVFAVNQTAVRNLMIRIDPETYTEAVEYINETWKRVLPNYPSQVTYLNDNFQGMYQGQQQMGDLFKYFAFLAVLIACLGLFGLASFASEQRTKEFGIRKVLGATEQNIVYLLGSEFVKLVVFSNVLAMPVAWYFVNNWLEGYAYRTELGIFVFAGAGVLSLLIALLTVSYQSIRAAISNPVKSLRYE